MAEIHIEQKRSNSWIWWLVALAVVAALLWWLFAAGDDDEVGVVADTSAVVAPVADAPAGPITDLAMLSTATTDDMAGRQVMLSSVPVQQVVSDRGFWIGSEPQRVFVVRGNQSSPATPPDGAVNAGQTVAVWGVVQNMPTDLTQQTTDWNLQSTDVTALSGQRVYVMADSVQIVAR